MSGRRSASALLSPAPGCPAGYGAVLVEADKQARSGEGGGKEENGGGEQDGVNVLADAGGISYGCYLQLDKLLSAQQPQSGIHGP